MYYIYVKLTTDSNTTAVSNYTELYDCKWQPITLTNSVLYRAVFNFVNILA